MMTKADLGFLEVNDSEVDQWFQALSQWVAINDTKTDCNSLFILSCLLCEIDLCVRVVPCLVWDHSYCLLATYFEHSKCRLLLCGYYASSGLQLLEFHQIAVVLQIRQFNYLYYREKEIKLTGPHVWFRAPQIVGFLTECCWIVV